MEGKAINSLSHTKWRCQYHLVFAPKYRRMVIYGRIKQDIGKILRQLCEQKGIEIIEAQACPDHIHMLVSIPPKYSVSQIMGYLKGKSSLMIFDKDTGDHFYVHAVLQCHCNKSMAQVVELNMLQSYIFEDFLM